MAGPQPDPCRAWCPGDTGAGNGHVPRLVHSAPLAPHPTPISCTLACDSSWMPVHVASAPVPGTRLRPLLPGSTALCRGPSSKGLRPGLFSTCSLPRKQGVTFSPKKPSLNSFLGNSWWHRLCCASRHLSPWPGRSPSSTAPRSSPTPEEVRGVGGEACAPQCLPLHPRMASGCHPKCGGGIRRAGAGLLGGGPPGAQVPPRPH